MQRAILVPVHTFVKSEFLRVTLLRSASGQLLVLERFAYANA
jgi:hypothetical protein